MLKRYKSLYLPALIIVATVVILLLVIAVSTYRTMGRERVRMEEVLLREGRVVIRLIGAVVRADYPENKTAAPESARLNRLLAFISREPEIAGISIIDSEGNRVAASSSREAARGIAGSASLDLLLQEKGLVTRYSQGPSGTQIFEIIQPLEPLFSSDPLTALLETSPRRQREAEPLTRWAQDKIVVLGFHLSAFEAAQREDYRHIILMGAILIVLGTGTLYFIFIVQNYYLVDRTLGQMRTYMENVVDSMTDGMLSLDENGHIVTLNRQAAEIIGVDAGRLKGRDIGEVFGETQGAFLRESRGRVIRDREVEMARPDGTAIPLSVSAAPLKDDLGRELGAVLIFRNLQEIRELQEKVRRSERLAALGRMAAGIAHEIRNPLSSIKGFAQLFLSRFKDQKTEQEYASIMIREVDRLNRVITELLDYARPKATHRESSSLEKIMDYTLKILAPELEKKEINLLKEYEPDLPQIPVDQEQLSQAFMNLLLNALEALERGGEIVVGMRRVPDPPGLEVTVADNGRGIPREDLEKVFEPFFSTKRKGTGLGLGIVHQIIENHGGEIKAENRPGGGTVFRIILPLNNN